MAKFEEARVEARRFWTTANVQEMCINNNLYTNGGNTQYLAMLNKVKHSEPILENIYNIACDIYKHSENQTICNIMYLLEKESIITTFEIDGQSDI